MNTVDPTVRKDNIDPILRKDDSCDRVLAIYLSFIYLYDTQLTHNHRRSINTEKKGKGHHCCLRDRILLNSLPRWLFSTKTILKTRINSLFSSNHPLAIHPILQIVL